MQGYHMTNVGKAKEMLVLPDLYLHVKLAWS